MASTYSDLKIELIGTGEQVGTWGSTTNTNLGTAIEEAITGSADVSFSSVDVTLTLTNSNLTQTARNLRLVCTGTSGGARNLILGSGCQIEKLYLIQNDLADTVTVKNTTGTGVAIPSGKKQFVFNDGTNVVEATNALVNLTTDVTGILPVANGGSGAATLTGVVKGNGTSAFTAGSVNLASEVTGTLPVANGGTGQTSYTNGQLLIGNTTGNTLTKATLTAGTGISITNGTGSITIAATNNGTVTSVGLSAPTGFSVSGSPVTSSGTLGLSFSAGYSLPTTASQSNWDTAYTDRLKWDGGSSGLNASTGRTSLGLGSMATQNSSSVTITGGSISGLSSFNATGANTSDTASTAIGTNALANALSTGVGNTGIGNGALNALTGGDFNTALGGGSGDLITTGAYNVCLGFTAGDRITTGTENTCIGYSADTSASGSTQQIVIGSSLTGQADSTVTIGNFAGKVYNAYTVNATWTQTSDGRLKKNIQDDSLGLSFINRLRPVKYQWKPSYEIDPSLPYYSEENKRDTTTVMHGLVAQEVKAALDAEGVSTFAGWDVGQDTIQAISREMFISPLINAIKELSEKCDNLQAEIDRLKGG